MNERILCESQLSRFLVVLLIIFIVAEILCISVFAGNYLNELEKLKETNSFASYRDREQVARENCKDEFTRTLWTLFGVGVACLLVFLWLRSYKMVITDKFVYGRVAFGRRVDLPIDSISAIGITWFKGIMVATSSGYIKFRLIRNRDEMYKYMRALLMARQER